MTAEITPPATAHPVPVSLSPSSMGTFTSCPLSFRFSYIERLPEPPSAPASKGTLVHLALQHLLWRPPA
ncbi:MAG TPA: PD-(D/E)XK nuclease family protein, partial [Acidimicrobiia bacterium]|nr:PD-(D/E)XK nuclease family protein [Acidimicrobiia bacterium]